MVENDWKYIEICARSPMVEHRDPEFILQTFRTKCGQYPRISGIYYYARYFVSMPESDD
jgi:hypothetical protein